MHKNIIYFACMISFTIANNTLSSAPIMQFALDYYLSKEGTQKLRIITSFKTTHHTIITVLENENGQQFIVKQDVRNSPLSTFKCTVRDTLGSRIAQSIGVNTNDVTIIPISTPFPGKENIHMPATLHTFVPGTQIKELPSRLSSLRASIRQTFDRTLTPQEQGLTRQVITNMAMHPQLSKIVAFDTFTSNSDRNRKNYFYDENTDSFFIIDFVCAFKNDLAHYGCNTIQYMIDHLDEPITLEELNALTIYKETLAELIRKYSPEVINSYFHQLAQKAHFTQSDYDLIVKPEIKKHKQAILNNYNSCTKLTSLIEIFLAKKSRTTSSMVPIKASNISTADTPKLFDGSALDCNATNVREIDFFLTNHSVRITTLQSTNSTKFILKQDSDSEGMIAGACRAAREKLGVSIAIEMGLNVNNVLIIPAYHDFPGKRSVELPATLHTFCPGTRLKVIGSDSPFYKLNVHQQSNSLLPLEQRGLTYEVIQNMTKHAELPIIVALDTFISNRGRHKNNLFYDIKTDQFSLIDLESSFNTHIGMYACNCIQSLINKQPSFKLSPQEIIVLQSYNTTLKKLLSLYTPEQMLAQLQSYIFEANPLLKQQLTIDTEISPSTNTDTAIITLQDCDASQYELDHNIHRTMITSLESAVNRYKTMITRNYASCQHLTTLLDTLLKSYN